MMRLYSLSVRFVFALVAVALFNSLEQASAATVFQPASGSWTSGANWSLGLPNGTQDGQIPSGKTALGDGLLSNTNIYVQNGGFLRVTSGTQILSGGSINIEGGGRLEYTDTTGTLAAHNTINMQDNSSLGRYTGSTSTTSFTSADDINIIGANSTIYIRGQFVGGRHYYLTGAITGGNGTKIIGENNGTTNGPFYISSATGNDLFTGQVIVRGTSTTGGNLGAAGTRPFGTATGGNVEVQAYGTLKLMTNTGVTSTGIINVQTNGRIDMDGANSSGNTINLATGTTIGRNTNTTTGMPVTATSLDTINIANNASIRLLGAYTSSRKLVLSGPITGSNLTITASNEGANYDEEIRISSASGNALSGLMIVKGDSNADPGVLGLVGTNPIGTMSVQIQQFGNLLVSPGALGTVPSVEVQSGGHLRFRNNAGSTVSNTTISGTGRVRSEVTGSSPITTDATLQSLTMNNVVLSPGASAGTLTVEASTLSLNSASKLQIELGTLSDLLVVNGNLNLSAAPTLELKPLAGLGTGTYVIATYSGTLTGQFGSVIDNLGGGIAFSSIDYGTLLNSQITVTLVAVPEPATGVIALMGMFLFASRRRRGKE